MLSQNNKIRLVKMVSIFILGNLYMFLGILVSSFLTSKLCQPYDKKKSRLRNLAQLLLEVGTMVVSVYLIRISIKSMFNSELNPLNGLYGFKASRLKEVNGGVVMAFAFLFFMGPCIKSKATKLYDLFHVIDDNL